MKADFAIFFYSIMLGVLLLRSVLIFKTVNVTVTCFALYFISSLTSIYFFYNASYDYTHISMPPIIYALCCIFLTFIPIRRYDAVKRKKISDEIGSSKYIYFSILFFSFISIEPFWENILHLPSVLHNQSSLANIYDARAEGDASNSEYLSWIGRKFFWINFLLRDLIPILFFYYIAKSKILDKRILCGLFMGIMNPVIHSFALGGRSTIINTTFYLIFVYILFRIYVTKERRRKIDKALSVSLGAIIFLLTIITVVRFASAEHSVDIWTWVSLYTGEGVLNFCADLWPIDKTCNGDNTFLFIRYILGLTDSIDIESVRATRDVLGVRNLVFYTFIGTIYYDFNKIGTIIYIIVFVLIFCKSTTIYKKTVKLSQLIYLSILGKLIMMGVMFYPYTLWTDQISLLLVLIFTWILAYKENNGAKSRNLYHRPSL